MTINEPVHTCRLSNPVIGSSKIMISLNNLWTYGNHGKKTPDFHAWHPLPFFIVKIRCTHLNHLIMHTIIHIDKSIHVLRLALIYYSNSPSFASNLSVAIVYVLGPLNCAHLYAHYLSLNAVAVVYGYPVALLELRYYAMSGQVQTNISLTNLCFNKYAFA